MQLSTFRPGFIEGSAPLRASHQQAPGKDAMVEVQEIEQLQTLEDCLVQVILTNLKLLRVEPRKIRRINHLFRAFDNCNVDAAQR